MRTLSATENANGTIDLDGTIVSDLEALRQRIVQAIKFQHGTWFLNIRRGIDYDLIRGHQTTLEIAAQVLYNAILSEGGDEVIDIQTPVVELDRNTRRMTYQANIKTIYGPMDLNEPL